MRDTLCAKVRLGIWLARRYLRYDESSRVLARFSRSARVTGSMGSFSTVGSDGFY